MFKVINKFLDKIAKDKILILEAIIGMSKIFSNIIFIIFDYK